MENAQEERQVYGTLLEKSKQPYEYLITNIQNLETDIRKKQKVIEDLEKQRNLVFRENEQQAEKIRCMEKDLKAVLNNRKQLDAIESVVYQLVEEDKKSKKSPKRSPKKEYDVESANSMPKWAAKMINKRKYA